MVNDTGSESDVCNVALHKPAYQSSVQTSVSGDVYPPFLANDGGRTSNMMAGSCAATQHDENSWFVVDLGIPMTVKFVLATHGRDAPIVQLTKRVGYATLVNVY